jgi:hypothetical protein
MPSYLDETGLAYFWGKIKTYVNNAIQSIGALTGVKGDAESTYRTGNVNLTPADIGSPAISDLDDYLPLTAGSSKPLTGDLFSNSSLVLQHNGNQSYNPRDGLSTDTMFYPVRTDTGRMLGYGIGAGGNNAGIFDYNLGGYLIAINQLGTITTAFQAAWRDALDVPSNADIAGIGDTVGHDQSSSISVPTSTWKTITSVDLTPGTWVLIGGVLFGSSSTGRRYVAISNNDGSISAAYQRATQNTCPAISGASVYVHTSYIVTITAAHTYYLLGWQNNGGALNCSGFFRAVRII